MSQAAAVLKHLRRRGSITSGQAWAHYNCTRLADVVHKLRRRGVAIDTELVPHKGTRYARYRMVR